MLHANNPGNIRYNEKNQWHGLADPPFIDNGKGPFCSFTDPIWGLRAMMVIIAGYKARYGVETISQLINKWAPPADDNPDENYIAYVSQQSGFGVDDEIDLTDAPTLCQIVPAICKFENGPANVTYTDDQYQTAAARALSL